MSPNRRHALFVRRQILGWDNGPLVSATFYVADVHGRGGRAFLRLPRETFSPEPRWSRDGLRFVFRVDDSNCVGPYAYWSAAADGTDIRLLGNGINFAWGPDSSTYAIVERGCWPPPGSASPPPLSQLVYVSGTTRTFIASGMGEAIGLKSGAVSPDGSLIGFEMNACTPAATLRIARTADGSAVAALRGRGTFAAWAPNGRRYVFLKPRNNGPCVYQEGAVQGALGIASIHGPARIIVKAVRSREGRYDPSPTIPLWSPNGRMIAYTRGYNRGLVVVRSNGRGGHSLVKRPVLNFWWSRDSKRLFYAG